MAEDDHVGAVQESFAELTVHDPPAHLEVGSGFLA